MKLTGVKFLKKIGNEKVQIQLHENENQLHVKCSQTNLIRILP